MLFLVTGKEDKEREKEREEGEKEEERQASQSGSSSYWWRPLPDHTPPSPFILHAIGQYYCIIM